MEKLIEIVDEILKWSQPFEQEIYNQVIDLEANLARLYGIYYEVNVIKSEEGWQDIKVDPPKELRKNIEKYFPDFTWYRMVSRITDFSGPISEEVGDAIDDLHDIILELNQVKTRYQLYGYQDAVLYFKFAFDAHIKFHLVDLLYFINRFKK